MIEFRGVQKSYDGETFAIKNLDLTVYRGEFLTLLGRGLSFPKIPSAEESAHHPARCVRSSGCLGRLSLTGLSRGGGLKSRTLYLYSSIRLILF